MNILFLKREIIESENLTEKGVSVYIALRRIMQKDINEYFVSYNMIAYQLTGAGKNKRAMIDSVKEGLQELIENNLVPVVEEVGKSEFVLELSQICINAEEDYFIKIEEEEVHKIFSIEDKTDKFKALRYFVAMIGTLNNAEGYSKVGYMAQDYFINRKILSKTQVYVITKVLEDNGIIFVYRSGKMIIDVNGSIKKITNCYGRAKDKQFITNFGRQHEKTCGINDEKKVVKMKVKENQNKGQQEETRYGISSIVTKKENTKVETSSYVYDEDIEF